MAITPVPPNLYPPIPIFFRFLYSNPPNIIPANISGYTVGTMKVSVTCLCCLYWLQEYVKNSKHPFLPLTRVAQGQLLESFESAFDDKVAVSVY